MKEQWANGIHMDDVGSSCQWGYDHDASSWLDSYWLNQKKHVADWKTCHILGSQNFVIDPRWINLYFSGMSTEFFFWDDLRFRSKYFGYGLNSEFSRCWMLQNSPNSPWFTHHGAEVSSLQFEDLDLDPGELGGPLSCWEWNDAVFRWDVDAPYMALHIHIYIHIYIYIYIYTYIYINIIIIGIPIL